MSRNAYVFTELGALACLFNEVKKMDAAVGWIVTLPHAVLYP